MACIEEATDEDYGLRINSPYRFALGYGVEVVDLNAYITCRVRSVECGDCNVLSLCQCGSVLFHTDVQVGFCQFGKSIKPCLEVCFFAFEGELEIRSQWIGIECGDEDSFRGYRRICNDVIRTLFDKREKSSFQQSGFHSFSIHRSNILFPKIFIVLLCSSFYYDVQYLTTSTTFYTRHHAAHRRNKFHFRMILVDKQGSTSHYIFLLFHDYLRRHSRKVIGYECVEPRFFYCCVRFSSFTFQVYVKAFT